jgi:hypothetical protein
MDIASCNRTHILCIELNVGKWPIREINNNIFYNISKIAIKKTKLA